MLGKDEYSLTLIRCLRFTIGDLIQQGKVKHFGLSLKAHERILT